MKLNFNGSVTRFADGVSHCIPSIALIFNHIEGYTLTVDMAFAKWNVVGSMVVTRG